MNSKLSLWSPDATHWREMGFCMHYDFPAGRLIIIYFPMAGVATGILRDEKARNNKALDALARYGLRTLTAMLLAMQLEPPVLTFQEPPFYMD